MKTKITFFLAAVLSLSNLSALLIYDPYMDVLQVSGSALCEDLKVTYKLPDSLKIGYSYTADYTKNNTTRTIDINYVFTPSLNKAINTDIVFELTNEFTPVVEIKDNEAYWNLNYKFVVDGKETSVISGFYPYKTCSVIKKSCNEVVYENRMIQYATDCGSGKGYIYTQRISKDSLIIDKIDVPVLAVCLEKDFRIETERVVFSNLDNLNYKVFMKTQYNWMVYSVGDLDTIAKFILPIQPMDNYYYLQLSGDTDLRGCVVKGIGDVYNSPKLIFPNPTNSIVNVLNYEGEITFVNQMGQRFTVSGNTKFDVSQLEKGIYIASFEQEGKLIQEKIIVE